MMNDRDPNRLPSDARYEGADSTGTAPGFDGFSGETHITDADAETRRAEPSRTESSGTGEAGTNRGHNAHAQREHADSLGGSGASAGDDRFAAAARREAAAADVDEKKGGMTAGLWLALILGIVVLVALLIFVVQNNVPASFEYISWQFSLPLGVAMLLAAIAGALIMALVGSVRMMQLSLQLRRYRKAHARLQETLKL